MANIPTHGRWCGARTYPTICQFCRSSVFYFQRNCGSKVFFNDLGGDGPVHRCDEYIEFISGPFEVEREYTLRVRSNYQQQIQKPEAFRIVRSDPDGTSQIEDLGVIRELIRYVDISKRCGIERSDSVGMGFLGKLGKGSFGQITVHVGDLSQSDTKSYTFYVETQRIERLRLERRQLVFFRLRPKTLPSRAGDVRHAWVCADIYHP